MKSLLLLVCVFVLNSWVMAQSGTGAIRGLVKDMQNQPVAGATVTLLKATDSSKVQVKAANDRGRFEFSNLPMGSYVLYITATSLQPYTGVSLTVDESHQLLVLPAIILRSKQAKQLKEVTVTARKPLLEHDIDKTIVNVEAMISASTGSTLEVLEKTPGVTIGADGSISLYGQPGVLVLIDGKPTYMSGQDLANYLRSLPGGMLDKIELMTNPPARYDAAGGSVINIRLKKNRKQGYYGNLTLGYNQGKVGRSNNALMLNYNLKKWNLFGSIGYNKDGNRTDEVFRRHFFNAAGAKKADVILDNYNTNTANSYPLRLGFDYALTSKTTVGAVVNYQQRKSSDHLTSQNGNYGQEGSLDSAGTSITDSRATWQQRGLNLNAQHAFNKKGRELTADLNYIEYTNDARQNLRSFLTDGNGAGSSDNFLYLLPSTIRIYNAKADYSHPFTKGGSFSAGVKWSLVDNDIRNDYYGIVNNQPEPDYGRSNHFLYKEAINAAYVNIRKDWKRFGMQLGLRAENTHIDGHQLGNTVVAESRFSRDYTNLFPSAFLSYKVDSTGQRMLTINYSRRLNRPWYSQLNPFVFFRDQYSYTTGNPLLNPSFHNNLVVGYRHKQWMNIMLQYNRINDIVMDVARAEGDKFIYRPENLAGGYMLALMTNFHWSPVKWLTSNMGLAGARFMNEGLINGALVEMAIYAWRVQMNQQFKFGNDWSAELSGEYTSRLINWQRKVAPRYWMNAAVQKKILKGKGSIKLSVDDIFYWYKDRMDYIALQQATAVQIARYDRRRVGVAFNWSFGKETFARKRRHSDNAADDVKGRVQ